MLRFDRVLYLSLLFKSAFSEKLSNSLWGSDLLLFSELIIIVTILFYDFIEFILLLYAFLVTSLLDTNNIWFHGVFRCITCFYLCNCYW